MGFEFDLINIVILFGAIQGFSLSLFLYKKQNPLRLNTSYFLLFLISLSFLNLFYALLDAKVLEVYKPLYLFPFPYKYLIGVGFYFYILYSFKSTPKYSTRNKLLLFLPAMVYGLLHLYWFSISVLENSYRITSIIIALNFFRINEFVYLIFTLILIVIALHFVHKETKEHKARIKGHGKIKWLYVIAISFLCKTSVDFLMYAIDLIIHHGRETLLFYYPNFILNSLFIYYVCFIGFVKPRLILSTITMSNANEEGIRNFEARLSRLMAVEEFFLEKGVTISDVATQLGVQEKELSSHINTFHGMNFSEYRNHFRINKVKELIASQDKFTLTALAEEAGFSSKSSFFQIFKKSVGMTPNEYKKSLR